VAGWTPLRVAALHGEVDTIHNLVDTNACPIDSILPNGATPLMIAASAGRVVAATLLLAMGAAVDAAMAARHCHHPHVAGSHSCCCGRTALMFAASGGHTRVVRALLVAGASVYRADASGRTALAHANDAGHLDVATALFEAAR